VPYHRPIPDSKTRSRFAGGVDAWVQAEKYIQIALVLPSGAFIGWLIGAWLDSRFHQSWIVVAGVVLGIIAGLSAAIRLAISFTSGAQGNDANGATGAGKEGSGKGL